MRRQHTTKTGKAMRMKFSCIISGCPEGARKWHIHIFAMFYIAKNRTYKTRHFCTMCGARKGIRRSQSGGVSKWF